MIIDKLPGRKWGDLIPGFGYARCYGCHRPWWTCKQHEVPTGPSSGALAMCERCWATSTTEERLAAYRWLHNQWARDGSDVTEQWRTCETHIRAATFREIGGSR